MFVPALTDRFRHVLAPSFYRREESSFERDAIAPEPPAKRVCTISPAPRHSPALTVPLMNPGGQFHPTPPPLQHYTLEDIATSHLYREPSKMIEHREVRDRHHNLSKWHKQHGNDLNSDWICGFLSFLVIKQNTIIIAFFPQIEQYYTWKEC